MSKIIHILFVADIVGQPGITITEKLLPSLKQKYHIEFCIANGENASGGKGISDKIVRHLKSLGVDVITSGNHIWDRKDSSQVLNNHRYLLRPLNYPASTPGYGSIVFVTANQTKIGVVNLQGRTFMQPLDNPFTVGLREIQRINKDTKISIVDFHAEASAEKATLGWYLDGKVSAVIGTHTHVQTADERILPNGTAYITDVGMTGPFDSVIGMKKEIAIHRFLHQTPQKYEIAKDNLHLCAVVISVEQETGKAVDIERIIIP